MAAPSEVGRVHRGESRNGDPVTLRLHDGTPLTGSKGELVRFLLDGHRTRETAVPADLIDQRFFPGDEPCVAKGKTLQLIAAARKNIPRSSGIAIPTVDDPEVKRRRGSNRSSVCIHVPDGLGEYYDQYGAVVFDSSTPNNQAKEPQDRRAVQYTPFPVQPISSTTHVPVKVEPIRRQLSLAEQRERDRKRIAGEPPYISPEQWDTAGRWDGAMLAWLERRLQDSLERVRYDTAPGGRMVSFVAAVATGNRASFDPNANETTFYNYKFESRVCRALLKKHPGIMNLARLFRAILSYAELQTWRRDHGLSQTA